MTLYTYPTPNLSLKSMAIGLLGSGFAVPTVRTNLAWYFSGQAVVQIPVSGVANLSVSGYVGATNDGAGNAYFAQIGGGVAKVSSSLGVTGYALASGKTYEGIAYNTTENATYIVASDGTMQVLTGGVVSGFGTAFGGNLPALRLASSGTTLFTLLPNASQLGFMNLTGILTGTSGAAATPMNVPSCLAVSSGLAAVAVGGYDNSTLGSGFTYLAGTPNGLSFVGVQSGTGLAVSWTQINQAWAFNTTLSGLGHPTSIGWSPSNINLLITDPTSGRVFNLGYALGTLVLNQTLSIANAQAVAISTDGQHALVAQTASNTLTPLVLSGATWVSGTPFAVASPTSLIFTGTSGAVIACSSGLALASLNVSGTWVMGATGSIGGFPAAYLARDSVGNIYSAGTLSGSGRFAISNSSLTLTATGSYVGSVSGMVLVQGQLVFADAVSGVLRVFGNYNWTQQTTQVAPAGLDTVGFAGSTLFAAGTASTWQYRFLRPYTLGQAQTGKVSIYNNGSWSTIALSSSGIPESLAWDASGNVAVVTLQNNLYSLSSGATFIGVSAITQAVNQPATTPIGLSNLIVSGARLYGSTSLNDSVVTVR